MGTRNLTAVFIDGAYKIAQYGQWDGYPSGQGITALTFLRNADLEAFKAKVRAAQWLTKEDIDAINAEIKADRNWSELGKPYAHLSGDRGAVILEIVAKADAGIKLQNKIGFAADSLFCEYAYIVDFDAGTFEVFKGVNENPLNDDERFHGWRGKYPSEHDSGYEPIAHRHTFQLAALPTDDEFLAALREGDDDENDSDN